MSEEFKTPRSVDASSQEGSSTDTPRLLRRSRQERVIAGVCGGLARYLDMDPILFRIAFLLLLIPGLVGLIIYIVAWIAIPEYKTAEEEEFDSAGRPVDRSTAGIVVGGVLVVLGVLILLERLVPWFDLRILGAMLLIGIGAAIVIRGLRSE